MDGTSIPVLIVVAHLINLFCLIILIRSGIQILYDHPKLYWTDDTADDNHWLRFGKKIMPKDRLWTSLDEAEDAGPLSLPGGTHNLGSGRHWHFTAAIAWLTTGMIYLGYLFSSGQWQRLIPTDWGIFSRAIDVFVGYLTLNLPADTLSNPHNALQQLTYAFVVFVLAPSMVITGLAMSPALVARFPGFLKLFGNKRQVARSLHFIGMVVFSLFILVHVTMAMLVHFYDSVKKFTVGSTDVNFGLALTMFLAIIVLIAAFNVWITFFTLGDQVRLRKLLTKFYAPIVRFFFGWMNSRQRYAKEDISPFFRANGYPPKTEEYERLQAGGYKDWTLKIHGMVENPVELTLEDLHNMPKQEQITKHNCIQGWTAVAEWGGVKMTDIIELCKPKEGAKYVLFHCHDVDPQGAYYYSGLRLSDMFDDQTILAYEMNGKKLPTQYGAPLRLRCEKKYGYKMAKYLKSIEFVDRFDNVGQGRGGYREDTVFFDWEASI
mgnify:CR=1 FL=1